MAAAAAATNAADSGGGNGGGGGVSSASQVWYNLAMVEADAAGAEARGLPEGLSNHDSGDIGSMEDVLSKEPASLGNGGEVEGGSLSFGSDESASSRLEAAFTAFLALEDPTSVGWQALGADTSSDTSRRSGLLLQRWAAVAATTDRFSNSGVAATVSSSSVGAAGTGMFRRAPPWPGGQVEVARGLLLDALRGRGAYAQAIGLFVHVDHGNSAASSIDFDSELPSCHALLCVGVATQQSGDLATAAQLYAAAVASGEAALHRGSFPVASPDGSGAGLQEAPLDQDARATLQNQVLTAAANGAVVLHEMGNLPAAVEAYKAVALAFDEVAAADPVGHLRFAGGASSVRNNLGAALLASGRHQEGVAVLTQALESDPHCGDCHVNLGGHWAEEGFESLAVQHYASALELNPQQHGLRFRVAMLMPAIPPSAGAVVQRRHALKRRIADLLARTPAAAAHHHDHAAAVASFQATSAMNNKVNNNGYDNNSQNGTSSPSFLPPLSADTVLTVPLARMVSAVERMHFYVQYAGWNDRPLQTSMARLYAAVCPELLAPSPQLAALTDQGSGLSENGMETKEAAATSNEDSRLFQGSNQYLLPNSVGVNHANTAKHGQHQHHQQRQHDEQLRPPTRVGFLSKFFGDDEPHGELLEGIVYALKVFRDSRQTSSNSQRSGNTGSNSNSLGRKTFVSVVLHVASPGAKCSEVLADAADEVIELSLHWLGTRAAVAKASLDVLIFADSLSEPLSYFLQMGRLAPVQCLFWGNPISSGKANIDYFISADRMELPHRTRDVADLSELSKSAQKSSSSGSDSSSNSSGSGSSHRGSTSDSFDGTFSNQQIGDVYSEQVVLLAGQGIWYRRPPPTNSPLLPTSSMEGSRPEEENPLAFRRSLGLEDHWTVHMCAQSLFKLHPSFDYVLRDVLLNDPNAHVVLTADRREQWTAAFKRRLRRALRAGARLVAAAPTSSSSGNKGVQTAADTTGKVVSGPHWRTAQALAESRLKLSEDGSVLEGDKDEKVEDNDSKTSTSNTHDRASSSSSSSIEGGEVELEASALASLWARVHIVPRQHPSNFSKLLDSADVVLHPFPFDGSRTASESLALGKPTVTLPSSQLRGRMAWALYATLNDSFVTSACVAKSRDEYVHLATTLGLDKSHRSAVSERIKAKSHLMWEDFTTAYEWVAFLAMASGQLPPLPIDLERSLREGSSADGVGGGNSDGSVHQYSREPIQAQDKQQPSLAAWHQPLPAFFGGDKEGGGGLAVPHWHFELPGPEPPPGDCFEPEPESKSSSTKKEGAATVTATVATSSSPSSWSMATPLSDDGEPVIDSTSAHKTNAAADAAASSPDSSLDPSSSPSSEPTPRHTAASPEVAYEVAMLAESAVSAHAMGHLEVAATALMHAAQLAPLDAQVANDLGAALQQLNRLEEAELYLRRAVVLLPGYTVAMSNLGVVVQGLGFLREAEFWFEQAVATDLKPYYAKLDQEEQEGGTFRSNTNSNEDSDGDSSTLNRKQGAPISSAVFNLANLFRDQGYLPWRVCFSRGGGTQGLIQEAADVLRLSARLPRAKCGGGALLLLALIDQPTSNGAQGSSSHGGSGSRRHSNSDKSHSDELEAAAMQRLEADLLASQELQSCTHDEAMEAEEGSLLLTFLSGRLASAVAPHSSSSSDGSNDGGQASSNGSGSGALNLLKEARRLRRDFLLECTSLAVFWHFLGRLPDAPAFYAKLEQYRYDELQRAIKRTDHSLAQQQQQQPSRPLLPPLPIGPGPPFHLPSSTKDSTATSSSNSDGNKGSGSATSGDNEGLHVVVQWYQAKPKIAAKSPFYAFSARGEAEAKQRAQQRQSEIDACLRANLEIPAAAQVHLLLESVEDAQALRRAAYQAARNAGPAAVAAVEAALGFNSRDEGFLDADSATATDEEAARGGGAEAHNSAAGVNNVDNIPMVFPDCCLPPSSSEASSSSSWKFWLKLAPLHVLGHRATVAELFAYAQTPQLHGHLVMVANADIFVGAAGLVRLIEDDAVHRKARRLQGSSSPNEQEDWLGGRVFALLRWEWEWPEQAGDESSSHAPFSHGSNLTPTQEPPQSQTSDSGATDSPTNAATGAPWSPIFAQGSKAYLLPRADSQDAWLFRSPLPPRAAQAVANSGSNFWLGVPRCDNRLAEVLAGEGGLVVSNPALALPVFHVQAQSSNAFDSASGGAEDDPISGSSSSLHGYPTMGQVAGAQRLVPLTTGWIV